MPPSCESSEDGTGAVADGGPEAVADGGNKADEGSSGIAPSTMFWACLAWFGFTQVVRWGLSVLQVGLLPTNGFAIAANLGILLVSLYGLRAPGSAGAPTEQNLFYYGALAAALFGTLSLLF